MLVQEARRVAARPHEHLVEVAQVVVELLRDDRVALRHDGAVHALRLRRVRVRARVRVKVGVRVRVRVRVTVRVRVRVRVRIRGGAGVRLDDGGVARPRRVEEEGQG